MQPRCIRVVQVALSTCCTYRERRLPPSCNVQGDFDRTSRRDERAASVNWGHALPRRLGVSTSLPDELTARARVEDPSASSCATATSGWLFEAPGAMCMIIFSGSAAPSHPHATHTCPSSAERQSM